MLKTVLRSLFLAFALLLGMGAGTASADDSDGWNIEPVPTGYEVTWTSPESLPLVSNRPEILLDGVAVSPTTVSADGREISATIPAAEAPEADQLAVRLSGRRLDQPEPEALTPAGAPWTPPADTLSELGFDPGKKGSYAIQTDDYTAPGWKFPGLRRKLEMKGHVVAPSDPGVAAAAPLVLFLHGRHSTCYRTRPKPRIGGGWPCGKGMKPIPSDLGYDYLQRVLASQGFVTVSIAANGINAQDDALADGGANARAELVRRHLDLWAKWVSSGERKTDLSQVILIGHSRGGEGVNRASEVIPVSAPYRVVGQVLLAPTDFARHSAAYIPTVTVLPYCDGDVSDLQGQIYTDNSIGLASGDDSLKSSVVVFGANHNFFNTEWTPGVAKAEADDDSWAPPNSLCGSRGKTRLSAAQQRQVGISYVAGAVQLMTGADDRDLALFDGSPVRVGPVTKASVISHSVGGGKVTLVAGREAKLPSEDSAGVFTCQGYSGDGKWSCAKGVDYDVTPHWPPAFPAGMPTRPALAMSWKQAGRTAKLGLDHELDLTAADSLDLRTVVDPATRAARLGVTLTDGDGNELKLTPDDGGRVEGMPSGRGTPGRWLARNLRVPVPATGLGSFDLSRVTAVSIVGEAKPECGQGCSGISRVRVLDISARPKTPVLAPSSDRLPMLQIKSVTRPEGGPGKQTVQVPFTVSGTVTDPETKFRVASGSDSGSGWTRSLTVSLTPGQTSGSIEIQYRGDKAFDRSRRIRVQAYPIRGIIPSTSAATIKLKNDDRKPVLKAQALTRSIRSGQSARWRVWLDGPVSQSAFIGANFAAAPGLPQLRLGDLPARWVERRTFSPRKTSTSTPLSRTRSWINLGGGPVERPRVIEVPTRSISGGPVRGLRLRVVVPGIADSLTPTVRILPD